MNTIIPDFSKNSTHDRIELFFKENEMGRLLKKSNFYKQAGVPCISLLKELVALIFTGKNLFRNLAAGNLPFGKNTAYRFLNEGSYNWEKLLLRLSSRLVAYLDKLTSNERLSVLIVDDSLYSRNRSKKVELMANVYDHSEHRFMKGFRMLTLGWSDGNTFIPIACNLVSSANDEKVCVKEKQMDKRTLAYRRRKEAKCKLTDATLELLQRAKEVKARYVLFDSWFSHPKTVCAVKQLGRDVICMVKNTSKVHYLHEDTPKPLADVFKDAGLAQATKDVIGSQIVKIRQGKDQPWVEVKLVFVSDRKKKDWLAILSTDINLSADEILRIYGKRWDIEVFFKVCKSHLSLAQEYQGRSYDLQTASASLVFIRYMILAMEVRRNTDERTIGELFYIMCDELEDIKLMHALALLLELLCQAVDTLSLSSKTIEKLKCAFLESLPLNLRGRLPLSA